MPRAGGWEERGQGAGVAGEEVRGQDSLSGSVSAAPVETMQ
jgi:hypothetical protein